MPEQPIQQPREVGRPSMMTPGTVDKLAAAFQRGFSVTTACKIARIDRTTYYKWMKESPEFVDRMDGAQEYAKILAGDVIVDVLQDVHRGKKDERTGQVIPKKYSEQTVVSTSKWFLEKLEKESFGSQSLLAAKTESDGKGGVTTTIVHASDGIFTDFFRHVKSNPGSEESIERQLLEVLEGGSQGESTSGGEDKEPAPPVHTQELQGEHTPQEGVSQS